MGLKPPLLKQRLTGAIHTDIGNEQQAIFTGKSTKTIM
jgi:hypothetical protein